jgi:hypothetical protein
LEHRFLSKGALISRHIGKAGDPCFDAIAAGFAII